MNATFEITETCFIKVGRSVRVDESCGEYVTVDVLLGRLPVAGQKDERRLVPLLLRKSEARAVASAMMGAAAEL